jgi:predicted negative regulator of RcsB-dependent stress response
VKRQTRKQLKTDKFAQDVGLTFSFLSEHRTETIRYGLIGLAVVILGVGYYFYTRHQAAVREDAMAAAMKIDEAIIAPKPTATNLNFATQKEKDTARTQAFSDLATKYRGTAEGAVGGIFIGAEKTDKGDLATAEKIYKDVMDSAPEEYSAQARISLAHVYAAEGKTPEAEKLLRYLIDHPTALVSKEEATLELGDILTKSNPAEALKLVQPLTTPKSNPGAVSRTAISKVALAEVGRIIAAGKN